jgi:hypothetical protein
MGQPGVRVTGFLILLFGSFTVTVLLARRKPLCIPDPPTPAHTVIQKTEVLIFFGSLDESTVQGRENDGNVRNFSFRAQPCTLPSSLTLS